jgi:hypothetical protein
MLFAIIGCVMIQTAFAQWYDYSTGTYHATGNETHHNITTTVPEPETNPSTSQDDINSLQTSNQNQYSAYSGVPFPNCVETVSETTVILHFVGSCSGGPSFEILKYYADFGYHVQSARLIVLGNMEATLVKTGVPATEHDLLSEMIASLGICPSGFTC